MKNMYHRHESFQNFSVISSSVLFSSLFRVITLTNVYLEWQFIIISYYFQKKSEHHVVYKAADSQHGANYHAGGSHKYGANDAYYGADYGNTHGAYGNENAYHNDAEHSGGYHPTSYHSGYGANSA